MAHKSSVKALDRTLRDIRSSDNLDLNANYLYLYLDIVVVCFIDKLL